MLILSSLSKLAMPGQIFQLTSFHLWSVVLSFELPTKLVTLKLRYVGKPLRYSSINFIVHFRGLWFNKNISGLSS